VRPDVLLPVRWRGASLTLRVLMVGGLLLATTAVGGSAAAQSDEPLPPQGGMGTVAPVDSGVIEASATYTNGAGQPMAVDIRRPADADGSRPAVMLVHGGGWSSGQASDMDTWADLLADAGWVSFSVDYRLSSPTQGAWPAALDDVQAALAWVRANASAYGGDPDKLVVLGESAGAHLTALLAIEGDSNGVRPAAAATWSAPLDLAQLVPVDQEGTVVTLAVGTTQDGVSVPGCTGNPQCEEFWLVGWTPWFVGCGPSACPSDYTAASPLGQATKQTAPLWMANSTEELVPLGPAKQFDAELSTAGVKHALRVVDGKAHAHGYYESVWNEMMPWLATELGVAAPAPVDFGDEPPVRTYAVAMFAGSVACLGVVLLLVRRRRDREAHATSAAVDEPT